jgi:hypothetical protein
MRCWQIVRKMSVAARRMRPSLVLGSLDLKPCERLFRTPFRIAPTAPIAACGSFSFNVRAVEKAFAVFLGSVRSCALDWTVSSGGTSESRVLMPSQCAICVKDAAGRALTRPTRRACSSFSTRIFASRRRATHNTSKASNGDSRSARAISERRVDALIVSLAIVPVTQEIIGQFGSDTKA